MPNYIEARIHICPKQCKGQNNATRNNELENIFLERWKIFNWLREKKATRFMLQEVNRIEKRNYLWKAEWGFEMPFFPFMKTLKQGFVFFSFKTNKKTADSRSKIPRVRT